MSLVDPDVFRLGSGMMTKGEFLLYHDRIVEAEDLESISEVIHDLMHEEYGEPRDALFALAMANKRILFNLHYFDALEEVPTQSSTKSTKAGKKKKSSKKS